MNRQPTTVTRDDGLLEAPAGTQATIDLVCTEPVASAAIEINGQRIAASSTNQANVVRTSLSLTQSGPYTVRLRSTRGVDGVSPANTILRVQPDSPPVVQWLGESTDVRVDSMDRVRLRYRAQDDYGVAKTWVMVQINGASVHQFPVTAMSSSSQGLQQISPNLAEWRVTIGDVMRVWIEAADATGQIGRSEPVRIIAAPMSVTPDQLDCVAELEQAAKLSQASAEQWGEAVRGDASQNRGPGVFGRNTHLARCEGLDRQLQGAVLRAITKNQRIDLTTALADMVDRITVCQACAQAAVAADEAADPIIRQRVIERAESQARLVRNRLRVLTVGERARCIRMDLSNLQVLLTRADSLDAVRASALRESLNAAGRKLDEQITALGVQPDDERLVDLLQEKVAAADSVVEASGPVNWPGVARNISPAELSQRLLAASRGEALRPDADFGKAQDLNLAACAIASHPAEALAALQHTPAWESAQNALRKLAGQNRELAAFDAAAGEKPVMIDPKAIANSIRAVEAKSDSSSIAGPDVAGTFDQLGRFASLRVLMSTFSIEPLREFAIERMPLETAKLLSQRPGEHLAAVRAAQLAAASAARCQARRQIESVPTIAELLDDPNGNTPTESVPPVVESSRPSTSHAAQSAESPGFEEPLRLYFDMLKKGR
jgi:hypothetical protein